MNCPRCNTTNPEGSAFCNKCGLQLLPPMQNQSYQQPQKNTQTNQYQYRNTNQAYQMNKTNKPTKIPLYRKTWFVVLMCVFFPPIGVVFLWLNKKPENQVARILLTAFLCVWTVFLMIPTAKNSVNEDSNTKTESKENKKEKEDDSDNHEEESKNIQSKEKGFIEEISVYIDESIAQKANDILINQIGFSEVEFGGQLGETSNFEIWVDGTRAVLTASDDVYRIFIPETEYVFYENGQVVMNAQQFADKTMDISEQSAYYIIAKEIVGSALKNPSSANYPSITFSPQDIAMKKSGDLVVVQSYVDAQNSLGAMMRTNYTVEFRVVDIDSFLYELVYANIDGNATGTYIEI